MRVLNIAESKKNFRKVFNNDCNDTFTVQLIPSKESIRIATMDRFFNVRELYIPVEVDSYEKRKVTISSVDRFDVLWDFIWNKNGFWIETYKDAYRGLETKSKSNGTIYTMAEVVFNTAKKRYIYKSYECDSIEIISK